MLSVMHASFAMLRSWTKIGKLLPGRSENAVKNRWNSAARKKGVRNQQRNMAGLATVSPNQRRGVHGVELLIFWMKVSEFDCFFGAI